MLEILEKSADETACLCEWAGKCGGCLYQTLPYEKQLAIKEAQIKKMLDNGGTDYTFEGIVSSPVVSGYRNKVELTFGDSYMGGPLALGMHQRGSFYDIAGIETCQIMTPDMRMAAMAVLDHFSKLNIHFIIEMRHEGVLRHLAASLQRCNGRTFSRRSCFFTGRCVYYAACRIDRKIKGAAIRRQPCRCFTYY